MTVILCEDLARLGHGLDLETLAEALDEQHTAVAIRRVERPCQRSARWLGPSSEAGTRLVLGVCSKDEDSCEVADRARQRALDPFGVELLNLGAYCARPHARPLATEKARLLLGAAMAKVRAYPGARPANVKPVLAWRHGVSRRALFTLAPIRFEAIPSVHEESCAAEEGCRICVGSCPHGALTRSNDGRMTLKEASCTGCGACVSACPRGAFELPGASRAEIEAQVEWLLATASSDFQPRGILFACRRGATLLERLVRDGTSYAPGWLPVEVPCVGMLTPTWLLAPLRLGASAVAALPCAREDCGFGQREAVHGRLDYTRQALDMLGASHGRVRLLDATDPEQLGRGLSSLPPCDPPPRGPWADGEVFSPTAAASTLLGLAEVYGARRDRSLVHRHSPCGVIDVAEGCTGCGVCVGACPTRALALRRDREGVSLSFDAGRCIGCGECGSTCPEEAIRMERRTDLRLLSQGRVTLFRDRESRCMACDGPIAPRRMLERISALLGEDRAIGAITRLCLDCRAAGVPRHGDGGKLTLRP